MKIDYVLMNPTGNMTILVETPVPAASRPFCTAALMALEPTAEQLGYVSAPAEDDPDCDIVLNMAGGEFCGNAAMSTAALYALRGNPVTGPVRVRVSGAEEPVPVTLTAQPDDVYRCDAVMPRPCGIREYCGMPLVELPGICHLIVTEPVSRPAAETAVRRWCAALGADSLGMMVLDEAAGTLTPLVYVPGTEVMNWENSCASGTAATGFWLAAREQKEMTRAFAEPAGTLSVTAAPDGCIVLHGSVFLAHGACVELGFPQG